MSGLFHELKRRNVFKVGAGYVVVAWLLAQIIDVFLENFEAPGWVIKTILMLLVTGFPLALFFAWAFELTPEGIKKEKDVDRSQSITTQTGHKLDRSVIVILVIAVALFSWDKFSSPPTDSGKSNAGAEHSQQDTGDRTGVEEALGDSTISTAQEVPKGESTAFSLLKSIAVLPFANRSNKDDDLFFTDGIHDDLLTQLAKIHDLKVISRTSVMVYRDTTKNMKEIGAELEVGSILEGGIQKVGDRVRVNVQLIDVAADRHLWAETFDRELTAENIFEIQSEIALEIVRAVAAELTPEEEQSISEVPTRNLAAYEAFLRGREHLNRSNYSVEKHRDAKPWLEQAISLDPDFSAAHAALAGIYGSEYWRGLDTSEELLMKYRAEIDRALQLTPGSSTALLASADYHYRVENDYRQSLQLIKQAIDQTPGNADVYASLGLTQRRLGQWHESIASFVKALELDPANGFYKLLQVETMAGIRDWNAIMNHTVALEDANPEELDIQLNRAHAQMNLTGDLMPLVSVLKVMPLETTTDYVVHSARVHWLQRDPDAAIRVLNSPMWTRQAENWVLRVFRQYQLASAYRLKGDQDKAADYYNQAVGELDGVMNSALQVKVYGGMTIALSLARLGRFDEALALAEQLTEDVPYEKDSMLWGWLLTYRAMVLGLAGDQEAAVNELKIALEIPTALGITVWDLHYDPNWDFMRDNPGFVELATPDNLIRIKTN